MDRHERRDLLNCGWWRAQCIRLSIFNPRAGYRAMRRGRPVVVPGLVMKLTILAGRLSPRWLVTHITRWFQERKGT